MYYIVEFQADGGDGGPAPGRRSLATREAAEGLVAILRTEPKFLGKYVTLSESETWLPEYGCFNGADGPLHYGDEGIQYDIRLRNYCRKHKIDWR